MDYHTSFIKKFKSEEIVVHFDVHRFFLNEVGIDIWNGCIRQYLDLSEQESFWLAGCSRRRKKEVDYAVTMAFGKMSEWDLGPVTNKVSDEDRIIKIVQKATMNNPMGMAKIACEVNGCWKNLKCSMMNDIFNQRQAFGEYNFHLLVHLQQYCQIKIHPKPKECLAEKEVSASEKQPSVQSSLMRELSALLTKLVKDQ